MTIRFRKKSDSGTPADHEFYGKLKLIWAHGRSDDPFYSDDEVKYHGGNRGQYTLRKFILPLTLLKAGTGLTGRNAKSPSEESPTITVLIMLGLNYPT